MSCDCSCNEFQVCDGCAGVPEESQKQAYDKYMGALAAALEGTVSPIDRLRVQRKGEVVKPEPKPVNDQQLLEVVDELQQSIDHVGDLCGRIANLPAPDVSKQWVDLKVDSILVVIKQRDVKCVALSALTAAIVTVLFNLIASL